MRRSAQLQKELRLEGASRAESEELTKLAQSLQSLRQDEKPTTMDRHLLERWLLPTAYTFAGLLIGVLFVSLSQAAPPESMLYPVQKATDTAAIIVNPSYRASVMMKRAAQVHEMVLTHASQTQIMGVLADYTNIAQRYLASSPENYAAFNYCAANLKAAAAQSTPPVRQAIMKSLASLDTT